MAAGVAGTSVAVRRADGEGAAVDATDASNAQARRVCSGSAGDSAYSIGLQRIAELVSK